MEDQARAVARLLEKLDHLDGRDSAHPEDYKLVANAILKELGIDHYA